MKIETYKQEDKRYKVLVINCEINRPDNSYSYEHLQDALELVHGSISEEVYNTVILRDTVSNNQVVFSKDIDKF